MMVIVKGVIDNLVSIVIVIHVVIVIVIVASDSAYVIHMTCTCSL